MWPSKKQVANGLQQIVLQRIDPKNPRAAAIDLILQSDLNLSGPGKFYMRCCRWDSSKENQFSKINLLDEIICCPPEKSIIPFNTFPKLQFQEIPKFSN